MLTRAQFVTEAREWVGTPWHHQQTIKGVGCDCAGLVRGVAIATGLMPKDLSLWPEAHRFLGYGRIPDGELMAAGCDTYMQRISYDEVIEGDVVLVRFQQGHPQHVGIISRIEPERRYWIEAEAYRHKRVIESRLMFDRARALVQAYRITGLA